MFAKWLLKSLNVPSIQMLQDRQLYKRGSSFKDKLYDALEGDKDKGLIVRPTAATPNRNSQSRASEQNRQVWGRNATPPVRARNPVPLNSEMTIQKIRRVKDIERSRMESQERWLATTGNCERETHKQEKQLRQYLREIEKVLGYVDNLQSELCAVEVCLARGAAMEAERFEMAERNRAVVIRNVEMQKKIDDLMRLVAREREQKRQVEDTLKKELVCKSKLEERVKELEDAKRRLEQKKRDQKHAIQELRELWRGRGRDELVQIQKEKEDLEGRINVLVVKRKDAQRRVDVLEQENEKQSQEIAELRQALTSMKSAHERQVKELEVQNKSLLQERDRTVSRLTSKIHRLEQERDESGRTLQNVIELTPVIASLRESVTGEIEQLRSLHANDAGNRETIENLYRQNEEQEQRIKQLEGNIRELTKERKELDAEIQKLRNVKEQNSQLVQQIESLRSDQARSSSSHDSVMKDLQAQNEELEEKIRQLESNNRKLTNEKNECALSFGKIREQQDQQISELKAELESQDRQRRSELQELRKERDDLIDKDKKTQDASVYVATELLTALGKCKQAFQQLAAWSSDSYEEDQTE